MSREPGDAAAAPPAAAPAPQPRLRLPWRQRAGDGQDVLRRPAPVVIWWAWVAFVVVNVVQVVIPEHDYFSVELAAGLAAVTGVAYACALRPRVVADPRAARVHNPYRDYLVGWGAVKAVTLGDCVELRCERPAPAGDKTLYCWALSSGRRNRMRARQREARDQARSARGGGYGLTRTGLGYVRMNTPAAGSFGGATAGAQARPDPGEAMAAELERRREDAVALGAAGPSLTGSWAWVPLACTLVPAAALLGLALAR